MRFQFWSMSEDSRVGILLRGSSVRVCLVVLNQGCCGSGQYNLPDRMLRLDANTTLNQSYVLLITLVNNTYQSWNQYLPSTIPEIVARDRCYISHCFFFFLFTRPLFSYSVCILQTRNEFNQVPNQIKVYFPICDSVHLLSHYYYYYNNYFFITYY